MKRGKNPTPKEQQPRLTYDLYKCASMHTCTRERERAHKKRRDTEEKEEFKVREQEKEREKRVQWPSLG